MNELALFAGAGGGILGSHLLGWRTVAAVEIEDYPRRVLLQRQADGILPRFPIWDDVTTFDGKPWRGRIDIITGGFPCQDISVAGKGAGITGERSGLWGEMARIICEVRPGYVLVENSPALTIRGLGTVLRDLATLGYDARWGVLGADDAGAPHRRKRIWILANAAKIGLQTQMPEQFTAGLARKSPQDARVANARQEHEFQRNSTRMVAGQTIWATSAVHNQSSGAGSGNVADTSQERSQGFMEQRPWDRESGRQSSSNTSIQKRESWWQTDPADGPEPSLGRVVDGMAHRVDRLAAIGNGQVPAVVQLAWRILNAHQP